MQTIQQAVNNIELKGFEGYDMSAMTFWLSEINRVIQKPLGYAMFFTFLRCFFDNKKWVYKKGKIPLLFFMQYYDRKDYVKTFNSLANLIPQSSFIYLQKAFSFNFIHGLILLRLLFCWIRELSKVELEMFQKQLLLNELIRVKKLDLFLKDKKLRYRLLTVFYDVETHGNFMVQKLKRDNVKTATISHGVVLAERDRSLIDYSGIELRGCISDFFLAWNKFSRKEALKQGLKEERIKVLGIPNFMKNKGYNSSKRPENKLFGIVLDNMSGHQYNKRLIKIANFIAKKINYKYVLRFHPTFIGNEYDKYVNFKFLSKKHNVNTIKDYSNTVEFSLIANSTVFIELIFLKHKVFRLQLNSIHDKFNGSSYNCFENENELEYLIEKGESQSNELFDEFCTVLNIQESYLGFFNDFLD